MLSCKGSSAGRLRILVTGVGGNVGQGILKALARSRLASHVVGTDCNPLGAGLYAVDRGYVVPRTDDPAFLDSITGILRNERIDLVFAAADVETLPLARLRARIEDATGAIVLVPAADLVEQCHDKWLTAQCFARLDIAHPETVRADDRNGVAALLERFGPPLVVKPRTGHGSGGVVIAQSPALVAAAADALGADGIVQRCVDVDGPEYTAAVLCDRAARPRAGIVLRRELLQGTSYRISLVEDAGLLDTALDWATRLRIVGPVNFQFKVENRRPVCFEVNPRFSGTSSVRPHFGYNDVELAARHFGLGEGIAQPDLVPGMVLRYWEEMFIPGFGWNEANRVRRVEGGRALRPEEGEAG
ncbi:ATP-grasp domain-containing protein [Roseomonas genomospecies 6]|uniref:ATP-grasp domain-containing protein n=1 Tax=Roseomonas genomospecies 6 TaxID=214106 RepID=A0A9W7KNV7_9PROT|nr:ATP-grasp domain-containing protein [Roseomonas genomospecies 6]KAA0676209.1 ATP-grasp domain-containing protein [Roseomonas genomospecies 6]